MFCSTLFSVASSAIHVFQLSFFLITLQEKIDTGTVEGGENVGQEDCIKMKSGEYYVQLVRAVESEQEVSVLCSE